MVVSDIWGYTVVFNSWRVTCIDHPHNNVYYRWSRPITQANQTEQQTWQLWIQPVTGNPGRWRFTSETTQQREKGLEIQHDQWMRRWQLETAEQREHRLTQRRQCCPQEQRNRSLEYQGQYQGLPSVIETERLHFRSQNISVRHGSYRSGKKRF